MANNPVVSQINQIRDCMDDLPYNDIPGWINKLSSDNGFVCLQAREVLTCIGEPAVKDLMNALPNASSPLRWQIIKVLENIQDPTTARILVQQLKDENAGVRWAASDALIALRRNAMPALLEALTHDFDSLWLRQGAHHILHVMKDAGILNQVEEKVFRALEGVEPTSVVPWAAEQALESDYHVKK